MEGWLRELHLKREGKPLSFHLLWRSWLLQPERPGRYLEDEHHTLGFAFGKPDTCLSSLNAETPYLRHFKNFYLVEVTACQVSTMHNLAD